MPLDDKENKNLLNNRFEKVMSSSESIKNGADSEDEIRKRKDGIFGEDEEVSQSSETTSKSKETTESKKSSDSVSEEKSPTPEAPDFEVTLPVMFNDILSLTEAI